MKRITLFLLVAFAGFLAFSQGPGDPTELEKLQIEFAEKNAEVSKVPSMERAPFSQNIIEPGFVQKGFSGKSVGYGWNAYGGTSGVPEGPVSVALASGSITSIQAVDDGIVWMAGGDFAGDTWYTISYNETNSGLYSVDPANGNYTLVGSTGYSMTGLAFDPENEVMFGSAYDGASANSRLYTVNLQTGAATLVGTIGPGIIIGIAADIDGNIYGLNLDDNLYSINSTTGAGAVIGPIGIDVNYAQDIGFDRDNGILYGTLYTTTGGFYQFNLATGAATLIGNFGAEVCAFGVPYTSAEDAAPAAVADFTVTAGDMGALEAALAWTNPSTTVNGTTLTELSSIVIERNGVVIETIANPTIGGAGTFVDNDISAPGIYNYRIFGVNTAGEGLKVAQSVYVGEDVPAAPADVELVAQGNDGYLTWEAPTEGLNGGYFQTTGITYNIVRYPGAVAVATGHTGNSFLDDAIPQVGVYYYTVQAVNAIGTGGLAASNSTLLGAQGVVFMMNGEVTSCEGTFFDSGGPGGDYQNNENFTLTFFPETEGAKMRFNFTAFNVESNEGCTWDALEVFDGPNTDATLVGRFCGITVPAALAELTSTHATGALTFRFTSDSSVPRPGWEASFTCYIPSDNDLRATAISGNTTPSVGAETIYNITVFNEGSADQLGSAYTVELKDAAHNVLASVPGVDITSGEVLQVPVIWTPDAEGPISIYGFVNFAADQVPANNSTPLLNISVQPGDVLVITIGTATTFPTSRMPWDFYWKNSISQTLYFPDEIGVGGGAILSIGYKNNFVTNLPAKAVKIWLGETAAPDLSGGWVDPSTLTLVYDGPVDFPSGVNDIVIPLQMPYVYTGGNLVIYSLRVWEDAYFNSNDRFYGTEDAGSNRTRRAAADATVYDPTAPPASSTLVSWHPNTTLYFSTAGLGTLEGTVTDGTDPIEGVKVSVVGTMASTFTDADGYYEFPYLLPDTYDIQFELFGYESQVIEDVLVEAEETTVIDVTMVAIPQFAVEGVVKGNDDVLLEGAEIWMEGYDDYYMVAEEDGVFMFPAVYGGTYDVTISMPGYVVFNAEVMVAADMDLGTIVLAEILAAPYGVTIDPYDQGEGNALLSWNASELLMLFQHDGAMPADPNAFFQNSANGYGVVYDLTSFPDAVVEMIDFHHLQWGLPNGTYPYLVHVIDWTTKTIVQTVGPINTLVNDAWEEDVNLGSVNVAGLTQVAILIQPQGNTPTDAYPDITTDATGPNGVSLQAPMSNLDGFILNGPTVGDFFINLWISTAYAPGKVVQAQKLLADQVTVDSRLGTDFSSASLTNNNQTIVLPETADKVFTGFNVYLNDMVVPVAEGVSETEFLFTDLAEGNYTAGVSAVYTTGMSEIITVDFIVAFGVDVTVNVTANSGESAEGASIQLENQVETQFVYTGVAGANGTLVFENVRKGTYKLTVTQPGFEEYVQENISIQDEATLDVQLIEIIEAPYGLLVVEGEIAGEAHFSWNNTFGLDNFADSFEDGTFDAWHEFIQGAGTPGEGGNAYWHATDSPDGTTVPDGTFVAKANWGYNIDTWLISPLVAVTEGFGVTFNWYSSYYWSVDPNPNAELTIEVSTDGTTWVEIWNWQNIGIWTNFTWYQTTVDLSSYAGQAVHVAIHLVGDDNAVSQIDNIIIGETTKAGTFALSEPVFVADDAKALPTGMKLQKAFVGYNVYLNDLITPVATSVATTEFLFTGLANGEYVAGVQSVYTSGASDVVTIPFTITNGAVVESFEVTFNVHMHAISFDPATDVFFISGSMFDWASPGSMHDEQVLTVTDDPNIYTITLELDQGTHLYKFFKNSGWNGGEWAGDPNRELLVDEDMVIDHVFGNIDDPVNVPVIAPGTLSIYPNPARDILHILSGETIREVRMIDMLGQVVYNTNVQDQRHELNVGGFRNGIYFVQVLTAKGLTTQRIQIVK